jgi:L-threonylcarbamoyladenylate synthase
VTPDGRIVAVDLEHPSREAIARACAALHDGGVVGLPTDTLYGLSCDPYDEMALGTLRRLKGHYSERPYVVLFDGTEVWLSRLVARVSGEARRLMETYWPGPLTIVLPAAPGAPAAAVSEQGGIALRHPSHVLVRALIEAFGGPLVSSSANRVGCNPLGSATEILGEFGNAVAFVLDGGPAIAALPSTVVDATTSEIRVLRQGALALTP